MISTAVVDLETSDLDADKGVVLVGCVKSSMHKKIITYRIDETDADTWNHGLRGHDYNICFSLARILEEHDVVVAHNGKWFDVPYLRTRLLKHRQRRLDDIKLVDPCQILRKKFRMRSNGLNAIIDHLSISDKKTPLDFSIWFDAVMNGSKPAMDKIVKHCVQDVKALDAVFDLVKPYVKILDERGSSI